MKTMYGLLFLVALSLSCGSNAAEKFARFGDLSKSEIRQLFSGNPSSTTIEFREGDKLPVRVSVEGDLLEGRKRSRKPVFYKF